MEAMGDLEGRVGFFGLRLGPKDLAFVWHFFSCGHKDNGVNIFTIF